MMERSTLVVWISKMVEHYFMDLLRSYNIWQDLFWKICFYVNLYRSCMLRFWIWQFWKYPHNFFSVNSFYFVNLMMVDRQTDMLLREYHGNKVTSNVSISYILLATCTRSCAQIAYVFSPKENKYNGRCLGGC